MRSLIQVTAMYDAQVYRFIAFFSGYDCRFRFLHSAFPAVSPLQTWLFLDGLSSSRFLLSGCNLSLA